ncbi:MAG: hypothetical protein ABF326_04845 [Arenicellales bacterium]
MKTRFDIHHLKALHSIYWLISEEDKRMWCASAFILMWAQSLILMMRVLMASF